jgi:hypothetical protein
MKNTSACKGLKLLYPDAIIPFYLNTPYTVCSSNIKCKMEYLILLHFTVLNIEKALTQINC